MRYLNIGGPIALAIVGAVMLFALNVDVSGIEISTIGIILLVAAAIWFVAGIVAAAASKKETAVVETEAAPVQRTRTVER